MDTWHEVVISGEKTPRDAKSLHAQLLGALQQPKAVMVDLRGLRSFDVTVIQLLVSARKSARQSGHDFRIVAAPGGTFENTLVRAGLLGAGGAARSPEDSFWRGE